MSATSHEPALRVTKVLLLLFAFLAGLAALAWLGTSDASDDGRAGAVRVIDFPVEYFASDSNTQHVELPVKNESTVAIGVERLLLSCSCAAGELPTSLIPPGEAMTVPLNIQWGNEWGHKKLDATLKLTNGGILSYLLNIERYPTLRFEKNSYSVNCPDGELCTHEVNLVSYSPLDSASNASPEPVINTEGGELNVKYIGKNASIAGGVRKHVYHYKVSAPPSEFSESAAKLTASRGSEKCSCHIKCYFNKTVQCKPSTLFLGRFSDDGEPLRKQFIIEKTTSAEGNLTYLEANSRIRAFSIVPSGETADGGIKLNLEVNKRLISEGPFVDTIELRVSVGATIVRVPVRVSGQAL